MLETGYQVLLLYPYYRNIGKRLIKSPKIYFTDTGLASYLLGLNSPTSLTASPYFPHLFETAIIVDFYKRFLHFGEIPSMYYLRTRDGLEIDLIIELNNQLHLLEIKSSATITTRHADALKKSIKDLKTKIGQTWLISRSPENFTLGNKIQNINWKNILLS